ncbi:MAG: hypothetical protein ACRC2R_24405 [Xenococcaceae cyanobacterium]
MYGNTLTAFPPDAVFFEYSAGLHAEEVEESRDVPWNVPRCVFPLNNIYKSLQ